MEKWREYSVHSETEVKGFFGKYRFLSNYHVCNIQDEGRLFPSTENAYMAAKTDVQSIKDEFLDIQPSEAKKKGYTVPLRPDWDLVKVDVMRRVVFQKFLAHQDLREALLKTNYAYLEETNHWGDKFWGVCEGEGLNVLGKILMETRSYWQAAITNTSQIPDSPLKLF